jgi:hypothetical protein
LAGASAGGGGGGGRVWINHVLAGSELGGIAVQGGLAGTISPLTSDQYVGRPGQAGVVQSTPGPVFFVNVASNLNAGESVSINLGLRYLNGDFVALGRSWFATLSADPPAGYFVYSGTNSAEAVVEFAPNQFDTELVFRPLKSGPVSLVIDDTAGLFPPLVAPLFISPGGNRHILVSGYTNHTAGIPGAFLVQVVDGYTNPAGSPGLTLSFKSSDPLATLPANDPIGTNQSRVYTATFRTPGPQTLTVSGSNVDPGVESDIYIINTNPPPTIAAVSPNPVPIDGGLINLTVMGAGFEAASRVSWNNTPVTTTFESPTQLVAQVGLSLLSDTNYPPPANAMVAVSNPGNTKVATFSVSLATPPAAQIIWTNPAPIVYGTPLGPVQLDASANVPGRFVYVPPAGAIVPTGPRALDVYFYPADQYVASPAVAGVVIHVTKAPLLVVPDNKTIVSGESLPMFTASYKGLAAGDTPASIEGLPAFSTTATATSPPGTYPITASAGSLSSPNYTFQFGQGTLTILPSGITPFVDLPASGMVFTQGERVVLTGHFTTAVTNPPYTATWILTEAGSTEVRRLQGDVTQQGAASGAVSNVFSGIDPGYVYEVTLTVQDRSGAQGQSAPGTYLVAPSAAGRGAYGAGRLVSPPGALASNTNFSGQALFAFSTLVSSNQNQVSGLMSFETGSLDVFGSDIQWLAVSQGRIQFQGVASVNGDTGYPFMVVASSGTASGIGLLSPRLRLIVWSKTDDSVIYDNQPGTPVVATLGPSTGVVNGSIGVIPPP